MQHPPRKKPKRQSHFDTSWMQEFQGIGESNEHFFNVSNPHTCLYDAKELISKCKKSHIRGKEQLKNLHNILTIPITS